MSTEFDIKTFQNEAKIALIAKCALIFFSSDFLNGETFALCVLTCGDANKALTVQIMYRGINKGGGALCQNIRRRITTSPPSFRKLLKPLI